MKIQTVSDSRDELSKYRLNKIKLDWFALGLIAGLFTALLLISIISYIGNL